MCGVIGIIGSDDVANDLFTGLFSLQHRGQDSTGIATFDGEQLHIVRKTGLVSQAFDEQTLAKLKGGLGIGHVRYPTVGADINRDMQPFFLSYPYGIVIAHNGNLANYYDLRRELDSQGRQVLLSKCDVELILGVLAQELVRAKRAKTIPTFFSALEKVMTRLNGSYSVVTMVAKHGLLAFRDPNAIRPLVFGVKEENGKKAYAFASETVALDVLGYEIIRDVAPGEAIFVDNDLEVHSHVIKAGKPAHCMFEWVYFARPDSVIEKKSVYEVRLALGRELAKTWLEKKIQADVVVPVPDSARSSALAFAQAAHLPQREGLIKNRYSDRTFIMPTQTSREVAMRMKLNPIIHELRNKRVVLVDDSIVRGTTSKRLVSLVRDAGAKEVHLAITCPPIKFPCFYGVDMATKNELIAASRPEEEIAHLVGADSVTYLTLDGLKNAIGLRICAACLDGKYPTDVSKLFETFQADRESERSTLKSFLG